MSDKTIIEIKIDENLEREGQRFYFKYLWKKQLSNLKRIIIYMIVFLAIGFFPIRDFEQNALYYIFRYGGVFFAIYLFLVFYQYFDSKKKNYRKIEDFITELKTNKIDRGLIIMDDKSIEFRNPLNNIGTVWEKTIYTFDNDYLIILLLNESVGVVFSNKEFVGNDYEMLISFLEKYSIPKK